MALFETRDPWQWLAIKPPPKNVHRANGESGGSSVGGDVKSQPKKSKPYQSPPPGLVPIERHSLNEATGASEWGWLAGKLHEDGSPWYKSPAEKPHNQPDSKIDVDVTTRLEDKYASNADKIGEKRALETKYDTTKYTGVMPPSSESGKATEALRMFKQGYDDALSKLDVHRETAILNNIKEPSVLSMLAGGKHDMISSLAPKPNKSLTGNLTLGQEPSTTPEKEYYDNLAKNYDKRYDHHRYHLSKKKLPNYSMSDQSLRVDSYNTKSVSDNNIINQFKYRNEDFIPLYFHDLVNKKYLPFRSLINSVSEGSDATWTETTYLGRADKVYVYAGFTRTLTLDFTVQAFSIEELFPMWQRINYLVGLTMPAAYTGSTAKPTTTMDPSFSNVGSTSPSAFIIPPFVKFRLGDMYRNQPVILTNVGTTVPPEAAWELVSNEHGSSNNYDYLNGSIVRNNVRSAQYPTMVTMSVSMTLLEKRAPETIARHFGDSTVESVHASNEDVSLPQGDFNHQLIHFGDDDSMAEDLSPEAEKARRRDKEIDATADALLATAGEAPNKTVADRHEAARKLQERLEKRAEENAANG